MPREGTTGFPGRETEPPPQPRSLTGGRVLAPASLLVTASPEAMMLKKVLKLLSLYQGMRHGDRYGSAHKPWKRRKWKSGKHERYGYSPHLPPHGYGPGHGPHGHDRRPGLKGAVIGAIVQRLLRHR